MTDRLLVQITPFATHGGRLDLARDRFGPHDWLDLSTGLSPWHYPVAFDAESLARLPSPDAVTQLEVLAAHAFGCPAAHTVAVPGSDLGLRLLGAALGARAPAVVWPGYSGHLAMWPNGATRMAAAAMDLGAMACDALVLGRPGNPGGELPDIKMLGALAEQLAARDGWLIVDEAFADATPSLSVAAHGWPGLIVLRSFGKFHGLAGLRLGFVIAPPPVAGRMRTLLGDWPISGPALVAGLAAYADTRWAEQQRARLANAAGWLDTELDKAGLAVAARTPFFRTLAVDDGWQLFDRLAGAGILTRPFADDRSRLRVGLPRDEDAAERLFAAAKGFAG